jgi:threonine synthase
MRFVTTRGLRQADGVSFHAALVEGLGPDGGLYMPERIEPWSREELSRLPTRTLTEIAYRALRPYTRGELDATTHEAVVVAALRTFRSPSWKWSRGFRPELFHAVPRSHSRISAPGRWPG